MVGQTKLLANIDRMVAGGFPRFTILCGPTCSGKKLIAKQIASKLNAQLIISNIKVDDVREIISLAYKQSEPTVYLLPDADKMSPAAKNALLKVTEEPPRKAYFVMTLVDINNTLATLRSRGTVLNLDPYTSDEILQYTKGKNYDLDELEEAIVANVCTVPGEVDILVRYNVNDFYNYVKLVQENIGKVSGANAFKITQKLGYKEEDSGWNVNLFMRTLMLVYLELAFKLDDIKNCVESINIVSKYLSQMNITGINKSSTFDMMILELRGIWVEE